ncbi:MAG: RidA family protein [Johnsonella sp.]|nr:RidA family protein [Johnsonella sp.]
MKKEIITTEKAPAAIGPYSQATKFGNLILTSGVIPVNPETGEIPESVEAQAEQAFTSLKALVEAGGSSMSNIIKTTVFIKNMNDFAKINEVYSRFFTAPYPSRSCVEVARLPKDVLLEIEAICYIGD